MAHLKNSKEAGNSHLENSIEFAITQSRQCNSSPV